MAGADPGTAAAMTRLDGGSSGTVVGLVVDAVLVVVEYLAFIFVGGRKVRWKMSQEERRE